MPVQRYIPIEPLASGGMADVWLGVQKSDTGFIRLCAIKSIKNIGTGPDREDFISMFRDEAKICQSLQHANVVQVFDFTELETGHALIMEYIQGVNLAQILRVFREHGQTLPLNISLYIAQEVAKGLQYVHTKRDPGTDEPLNIVHRDISPSNILISSDGEIKITDFGIAKANTSSHETQVGVVKGKFQYMSPEQFNGVHTDHRSDTFALAVVLWECLAGRRVYESNSEAQLIQMIMQRAPYPNLVTLNPEVDENLVKIISTAMHEDMHQRTNSAGEFAEMLQAYATSRGISVNDQMVTKFLHHYIPEKINATKDLVRSVVNKAEKIKLNVEQNNSQTARATQEEKVSLRADASLPQIGRGIGFTSSQGGDNQTSNLKWENTVGEKFYTKHKRHIKRKQSPSLLGGILTFSFAILLASVISVATAHYGLKIDILSRISQLSAKLKTEYRENGTLP